MVEKKIRLLKRFVRQILMAVFASVVYLIQFNDLKTLLKLLLFVFVLSVPVYIFLWKTDRI